jgi:hypothetical protein
VQLGESIYATTNQRFSLSDPSDNEITKLFWAESIEAILRAVYGQMDKCISSKAEPPKELLVGPGCLTFGQIRRYAEEHGLDYCDHFVWSRSHLVQPCAGVVQDVKRRFEYYFLCAPEESSELKNWDDESIVVIGFRTILWNMIIRDLSG